MGLQAHFEPNFPCSSRRYSKIGFYDIVCNFE
jgi:hypothetical protein